MNLSPPVLRWTAVIDHGIGEFTFAAQGPLGLDALISGLCTQGVACHESLTLLFERTVTTHTSLHRCQPVSNRSGIIRTTTGSLLSFNSSCSAISYDRVNQRPATAAPEHPQHDAAEC